MFWYGDEVEAAATGSPPALAARAVLARVLGCDAGAKAADADPAVLARVFGCDAGAKAADADPAV